jgi:hypothetical protein
MSLVHRREQVEPDVIALECHECGHRHSGEELNALLVVFERDFQCLNCMSGGMIPRTASRIDERFPPAIAARFTPLPEELLQKRVQLGIGSHELLVIWSMEWHRRAMGDEVFPSRERMAAHTGLSVASVKRAVVKLEAAGLISVRHRPRGARGRLGTNQYNLDALWTKLAAPDSTTGHTDPWSAGSEGETSTMGQADPWTTGHSDPRPRVTQTPEVDVVEVDVFSEVDPVGTSPAAPDVAATNLVASIIDRHHSLDPQQDCQGAMRVTEVDGDLRFLCCDACGHETSVRVKPALTVVTAHRRKAA